MTPPYHFYLIRLARRVEGLRLLGVMLCCCRFVQVRASSVALQAELKRSASVPLTAASTNPVCAAMRSLVLTGLFVLFKVLYLASS